VATPVELPVAGSASLIGRVSWWGAGGYSKPRNPNHWPPTPIYSTARRGPISHVIGLDVPDQDARLGPRYGRWAKSGGDQTNTSYDAPSSVCHLVTLDGREGNTGVGRTAVGLFLLFCMRQMQLQRHRRTVGVRTYGKNRVYTRI
jgi:hypothetical protein